MIIREIQKKEGEKLGQIMLEVYSNLDGFPTSEELPFYYKMLREVGQLNEQIDTKVLVALNAKEEVIGGIVYFSNMAQYSSGGIATQEKKASGIRLLAVSGEARGMGIGRALANACIDLARESINDQVILHTTDSMQIAWKMYEKLGFKPSQDLDFLQGELPVYGFRLQLH